MQRAAVCYRTRMALVRSIVSMRLRRIVHGIVDSTSERAFAALAEGRAMHGDVHLALGQTSGRGRLGRSWWSEPGAGLYASIVLRPSRGASSAALTMAGGLAVLDAVRALGATRARLKWPNDVMVGNAKLCGVLAETRGFDPASPAYVLGVGINVAQTSFPSELIAERDVTSLRLLGSSASVQDVEELVLSHLELRLEQITSDPLRLETDFLAGLGLRGAHVRVSTGTEEISGHLAGLSLARGLILATVMGEHAIPLEWIRALA
jgi:BirA family biotin operon repressor/biotin-[acetyl-CoA-carboxylase] ligase